ncbi:MAG: type II toxin-antitoxin system VapC family toxin [Terriglobales bacterium]
MKSAVVDAHALIWLAGQERRLGQRARRFFAAVERGQAVVCVPTVVLVEMGEASHRGRIVFPEGFEAWLERLALSPQHRIVDLTLAVVWRAQELYGIPERSDRLVAATAMELGCPVITGDAAIQASGKVAVLWD